MARYARELGASSPLRSALDGYTPRAGQQRLAELIGERLDRGGALVAEAATGIGKSLAYLVPVAASGQRVVVTTATRTSG